MSEAFSAEARATFERTILELEQQELYPFCPRCAGEKQIYAQFADGFDDYVTCPCCLGTGEAEADKARDFIGRWEEKHGDD